MVRAAAATGRNELTSPQHCFDNHWMMSISPEDEPVQLAGLARVEIPDGDDSIRGASFRDGKSGRAATADLLPNR